MRTIDDAESPEHGLNGRQASEFLGALLGIVADDLRRPLQILQCTHDWLASQADIDCERNCIARSERAIGELTDQLDSLVSALRLYGYTRTMEPTEVALSPLLSKLSRENAEAAASMSLRLKICDSSHRVISNPVLLRSIFGNFLSNAIKYTRPGGRILVGCRQFGEDVRIDAYHTGLGTAPGTLPRIFEAFQRLDSTSDDGLGLGLFAVRRAIGVLGHRIEVASIPGRGCRFSVSARIARAH
jgi:two-component system phosphate regulon sensor histidine kinase PhoR